MAQSFPRGEMEQSTQTGEKEKPEKTQLKPAKVMRAYLVLAMISGTIILLDQWSKAAVRANLAFGESWMPWEWLAPYARVLNWGNEGAAFGLFQGGGGFFALLAIVVALLIVYYYPRIESGDWVLRLAMSMQLGGALGNLIDRLNIGYVTDFISIGTFPVFNIADASITVGASMLLLYTWLQDRKKSASAAISENANE